MSRGFNLDLETRLNIVKTADEVLKDCKECWSKKVPIEKENVPTLQQILKKLTDDLYRIKEQPVVVEKDLAQKRESYINSLIDISRKHTEDLSKFAKQPWYYRVFYHYRTSEESAPPTSIFLVDLKHLICGIDELAVGMLKAESIRNGELTKEELDKDAEEKAKLLHKHCTEGMGEIEKNYRSVAELIWSGYYMINPIKNVEDENLLYQILASGNYRAWNICYQKRLVEIAYVNKVKDNWYEKWKDPEIRRRMAENKVFWTEDLCLPYMHYISLLPELHVALLEITERKEQFKYVA
jgi:hypothetical protein